MLLQAQLCFLLLLADSWRGRVAAEIKWLDVYDIINRLW